MAKREKRGRFRSVFAKSRASAAARECLDELLDIPGVDGAVSVEVGGWNSSAECAGVAIWKLYSGFVKRLHFAHNGVRSSLTVTAFAVAAPAQAQFAAIRMHAPEMTGSTINAVSGGMAGGAAQIGIYVPPILWNSLNSSAWVSLAPASVTSSSQVTGMAGSQQAGDWFGHAAIWSGSAASLVDLNPSGAIGSIAYSTTGTVQGGYAVVDPSGNPYAAMWTGSAQSWVNLHPLGATRSIVYAVNGNLQGGEVLQTGANGYYRPVLWSGSAASIVNLQPVPNSSGSVRGMWGDQQVGWVERAGLSQRAAIWNGTAASFRDLHPPWSGTSYAYATCGSAQVGTCNVPGLGGLRACIWFGSSDSFLNLSQFLPPGYSDSAATCVEFVNGSYTIGGWALRISTNQPEAFIWKGVPAPGTMLVLSIACVPRRRRSGFQR